MKETQLFIHLIGIGTPDNVKFNIFKRINTPGLKLENQEIRHALYQGKATNYLKEFSQTKEFIKATNNGVPNERMQDREFILRFFALQINYEFFSDKQWTLDEYLNQTMKKMNDLDDSKIFDIANKLSKSLEYAYKIFGEYAFRRITEVHGGRKNQINVGLFESWTYNLSKLTEIQLETLVEKNEELKKYFLELLENKRFVNMISSAKKNAVLNRIAEIEKIIMKVIN